MMMLGEKLWASWRILSTFLSTIQKKPSFSSHGMSAEKIIKIPHFPIRVLCVDCRQRSLFNFIVGLGNSYNKRASFSSQVTSTFKVACQLLNSCGHETRVYVAKTIFGWVSQTISSEIHSLSTTFYWWQIVNTGCFEGKSIIFLQRLLLSIAPALSSPLTDPTVMMMEALNLWILHLINSIERNLQSIRNAAAIAHAKGHSRRMSLCLLIAVWIGRLVYSIDVAIDNTSAHTIIAQLSLSNATSLQHRVEDRQSLVS